MPTKGWNETAPWIRKFRSNVKANIYLKPCIHLKSEKVNIEKRALHAKSFEFFKSCISRWDNGQRMNWPPPKKDTPLIVQPPWNQKYIDLPPKPKILILQLLPCNLTRGGCILCYPEWKWGMTLNIWTITIVLVNINSLLLWVTWVNVSTWLQRFF